MRALLAWLLLVSTSNAATYYVATTGSNGNAGTSTGAAWADPGYAAQQMGDGDICYVKSGTYNVTTTTPGAAGPVKFAQASLRARMEGYSTSPGDLCVGGSKPIISADASLNPGATCNLVEGVGATNEPHIFISLRADANSEPNTVCFKGTASTSSQNSHFYYCEGVEASGIGFSTCACYGCYAGSNGASGFNNSIVHFCYAESNTTYGFAPINSASNCIARANGAGGFFLLANTVVNCVAYGNTTYGFSCTRNESLINCVAISNTTYGFSTADHSSLVNCASYNNTTARTNVSPMIDQGGITLSGDPFVNAAADDFTPDATANEGALLRAAGINPYGHAGYRDVGAVQHQDSGGGGNVVDPLSGTIPGL